MRPRDMRQPRAWHTHTMFCGLSEAVLWRLAFAECSATLHVRQQSEML